MMTSTRTIYPDLSQYGFSSKVVEPFGSGSSRILLVGEAPGDTEDRTGIPFNPAAPAGSTLERLLRRGGWQRDQFRIVNTVWQRPPRNWLEGAPWETAAIEAWRPSLEKVIDEMQPKVIIALGNIALKALTNYGGKGASITNVAGYVLQGHYIPWVIPTYHPSYLLPRARDSESEQDGHTAKNVRFSGAVIFAFARAMEIVKRGFEREVVHYTSEPSLDELLSFERLYNPEHHVLSYDIETPYSGKIDEEKLEEEDPSYTIIRASLSYETGRAISFPWQPPYVEVATRMLGSLGPKRVWNGLFDNPRLRANNCPINGRNYDVMEAWSFLQRSLPRGLAFVTPFYNWTLEPWKHLSDSDPGYYSCCDADALHRNGEGIERDLRAQGRWERYESHVVDCYEVLTQMSKNGLPFDLDEGRRFLEKLEMLMEERSEELQQLVSDDLKPPKQKGGLKREPKELAEYVQRTFKVLANELGANELETLGISLEAGKYEIIEVKRWCKLEPFLPTSTQQVQALIKHYGHKVGRNRKTQKDSADDDTIKKIIIKCNGSKKVRDQELARILKLCRECRQLSKVKGTYAKPWMEAAKQRDGRVHSTPGFWGDMYRISWRRPNIAATVADKKEEQIAAGFRNCVAAPEGKVLVEADWKGMEAVLVGYFANDGDYQRLARLGVHDYMAAHLLVDRKKMDASNLPSLAWSDSDLSLCFKELKEKFPVDRDDAKHCIAEDSLVLTNKGLVPIQNITRNHKLWDGVEWVEHDGLLDQGIREVIEHDGLTATADHEVFTKNGLFTTLGKAKSLQAQLESTGLERKAIRTRLRSFIETTAKERLLRAESSVSELLEDSVGQQGQFTEWQDEGLCEVLTASLQRSKATVELEMGRYCRTLYSSSESRLLGLWGSRDKVFIQGSSPLCSVGTREPSAFFLPRLRDRQNRQRWSVRSRQHSPSNSQRADEQYEGDIVALVPGRASTTQRLRQPLRLVMDLQTGESWDDGGADYRACHQARSEGKGKDVEAGCKVVSRARVYDILNAGPRRCFTVSGKLVANCVHGISYGMTWKLMSEMYELAPAASKRMIALFFTLFPKVKKWQEDVLARAHQECRLTNPFGYVSWFWDVLKWDGKKACFNGLGTDAKSAISFLPRDTGAAMLKEVLLRLERKHSLASQGILLASTHDSGLGEIVIPRADWLAELLVEEMSAPVPELGGLTIDVEVAIGKNWSKKDMKEWRPLRAKFPPLAFAAAAPLIMEA